MEINWVTVAAQIVNFLILVWLLQKFLYGPITRAMSAREASIRKRSNAADDVRRAAEDERAALQTEREDFARQKEELLSAAHAEAESLRQSLEREAREKIDQERARWYELLQSEKRDFLLDVRAQTETEFFTLARGAFNELADSELEKRLVEKFVERLAVAPDVEKETLVKAAHDEKYCGQVLSAFPIAQEERAKLQTAINDMIDENVTIEFGENSDLLGGIKLRIGGQTIEWSIAKYLDALQERLSGLIPENQQSAIAHSAERAAE